MVVTCIMNFVFSTTYFLASDPTLQQIYDEEFVIDGKAQGVSDQLTAMQAYNERMVNGLEDKANAAMQQAQDALLGIMNALISVSDQVTGVSQQVSVVQTTVDTAGSTISNIDTTTKNIQNTQKEETASLSALTKMTQNILNSLNQNNDNTQQYLLNIFYYKQTIIIISGVAIVACCVAVILLIYINPHLSNYSTNFFVKHWLVPICLGIGNVLNLVVSFLLVLVNNQNTFAPMSILFGVMAFLMLLCLLYFLFGACGNTLQIYIKDTTRPYAASRKEQDNAQQSNRSMREDLNTVVVDQEFGKALLFAEAVNWVYAGLCSYFCIFHIFFVINLQNNNGLYALLYGLIAPIVLCIMYLASQYSFLVAVN